MSSSGRCCPPQVSFDILSNVELLNIMTFHGNGESWGEPTKLCLVPAAGVVRLPEHRGAAEHHLLPGAAGGVHRLHLPPYQAAPPAAVRAVFLISTQIAATNLQQHAPQQHAPQQRGTQQHGKKPSPPPLIHAAAPAVGAAATVLTSAWSSARLGLGFGRGEETWAWREAELRSDAPCKQRPCL